jgi:hypothetical protein
MNGGHCAFVLLGRVTRFDDRDLFFDRVSKSVYNLGKFIRLVEAILAILASCEREMQIDLVVTGRDLKNHLAFVVVIFAARKRAARVLNRRNDVCAPGGVFIQKLASLDMKFSAHFLFLILKLKKIVMVNDDMVSAN